MKLTPIARTLTATALTNPDPAFVSLCTGPANQTPFNVVRSDDAIPAADVELETDDMKIKRTKATSAVVIAERGHSVMQFAFSKDVFKTADDVTKWMTDGGYSSYKMEETSKSFEVSDDSGTRFEVGSTNVIKGAAPGVTAYVGKLSNEDDDAQVVDDEPAAEPTTKAADIAPRARTRATPAEPVVVEPVVETPPVVEEPAAEPAPVAEPAPAVEETVAAEQPVATDEPVLDAELVQKIDAIFAEHPVTAQRVCSYSISRVAEVISTLRYILSDADYEGIDDTTVANLKSSAKSAISAIVSLVSQYSTEMTEVFRKDADASVVQRSAEPAAEPVAPADPVVEPAPAQPDMAELVKKAVAEAVAPLITEAADAKQKAADAEKEASEARQRAEKAEGDLAERVEADASRGQTRRSVGEIDPPVTDPKPEDGTVKRSRAGTRILESFGSRHAR